VQHLQRQGSASHGGVSPPALKLNPGKPYRRTAAGAVTVTVVRLSAFSNCLRNRQQLVI
jgi:hypothetical protein